MGMDRLGVGVFIVTLGLLTGACGNLRSVGVLTDPLPPARPLQQAGIRLPSPSKLNPFGSGDSGPPIAGERQIDLVALLETALSGGSAPKQDLDESERHFVELVHNLEEQPAPIKKKVRNQMVGQLVDASLANCDVYLKSLRGSQVGTRTFFDVVTGGLSTAGGLSAPASSAKLLSGLASFSNAAGASVDRDVFAEQGVELVAQEVEKARADERVAIEKSKTEKEYDQWDLGAALADVTVYHSECSMVRGLARVQNAVQTRDSDLRSARLVAQKVMAAGGNDKQVNAALAGVLESALGPTIGDTTTGSVLTGDVDVAVAGLIGADVSDLRDRAVTCVATAKTALAAVKTPTFAAQLGTGSPFSATCGATGDAWANFFYKEVQAALAKQQPALDAWGQQSLAAHADGSAPTDEETKAWTAQHTAALDALFSTIKADVSGRVDNLAKQIVERRKRVLDAARSVANTGGLASDVKVEVAATAGPFAASDPVLSAITKTLTGISDSFPGAIAEAAARASATLYLKGYKAASPLS